MPHRDALKDELLRTDAEFQRLHAEHQEYESRLQAIHQKSLLSQEDEVAEKQIKLHKLALKDRMEQILHERAEMGVAI